MNEEEKKEIEKHLAEVAPEHLEGFKNGWLYIEEHELYEYKFFNIYSKEGSGIKLIAVYRK